MQILEQIIYFIAIVFFAQIAVSIYQAVLPAEYTGEIDTGVAGASGEELILQNNQSAVNPTYAQAVDFILQNNISSRLYAPRYTCGDFAKDVHNAAESAGLKCAFVCIDFADGTDSHACNCFNTTDKGLIYFDCVEGDKIAIVEEGKNYSLSAEAFNRSTEWESLGIVKSFKFIW